jgi:hypothetical protein
MRRNAEEGARESCIPEANSHIPASSWTSPPKPRAMPTMTFLKATAKGEKGSVQLGFSWSSKASSGRTGA